MTPVERARLLVDAKVPFVHQGRDINGIDCVGTIVFAYQYPVGDVPAYSRDPSHDQLDSNLERVFGKPVHLTVSSWDQLQEGDVVSMQYKGPSRHVGLVANHRTIPGALSLIHTDSHLGKVTEHIMDSKWLRRVHKVYRP